MAMTSFVQGFRSRIASRIVIKIGFFQGLPHKFQNMLRTKQTHTYKYNRFIQNHFDLHTPSRQPHHRFQFLNSKYTSPFFFFFYIASKILTSTASSATMTQ